MKVTRPLWVFAVFITLSCTAPEPVSLQEMESGIKTILEIPTYEQIYRDIVYVGKRETLWIFRTVDKEVLFSVDVRVQAGYDLTRGYSLSRDAEGVLEVALPAPEILLIDADEESINQYFVKEKGEKIARLEYYEEINRQKKAIGKQALESGILGRAEENAKTLLRHFFRALGAEKIRFIRYGGADHG